MEQEGTFNGNPLSMAAARAVLSRILTRDAYPAMDEIERVLVDGLDDVIASHGLEAVVASVRCRGSIHFVGETPRNFREAVAYDDRLQHLAWLYQLTGGVFSPAGDPWTFGVAHTAEDVAVAVDNFSAFADAVTRS
jgi:glutamate-1-semialdehyde 2,1-aminomutase